MFFSKCEPKRINKTEEKQPKKQIEKPKTKLRKRNKNNWGVKGIKKSARKSGKNVEKVTKA